MEGESPFLGRQSAKLATERMLVPGFGHNQSQLIRAIICDAIYRRNAGNYDVSLAIHPSIRFNHPKVFEYLIVSDTEFLSDDKPEAA